jgi:hypothetical protein
MRNSLQPLGLIDSIGAGANVFQKALFPFLLITLFVFGVPFILGLVFPTLGEPSFTIGNDGSPRIDFILLMYGLFWLAVEVIHMTYMSVLGYQTYVGSRPLNGNFLTTLRTRWRTLFLSALLFVLMILGVILAISFAFGLFSLAVSGFLDPNVLSILAVAGIIIFLFYLPTRFFFFVAVALFEDLGPVQTLRRASQLSQGMRWQLFFHLVIGMGLTILPFLPLYAQINWFTVDWQTFDLNAEVPNALFWIILGNGIQSLVFNPLMNFSSTILYITARLKNQEVIHGQDPLDFDESEEEFDPFTSTDQSDP